MARTNSTKHSIHFFKIILQTNLQRLKIPNKFTKSHGVGLSNPVLINPPDGTKWKVYWKNINGEIWFEKGWKSFTQNYSLGHGSLVVFKYKEGTSKFDVLILGQSAVEIDYDPSSDTHDDDDDKNDNVGDSDDDEPVKILDENSDDESVMILDELSSPRPHKKVRGETKNITKRTSSLNMPKEARAQEIAENFISSNPFFTILINTYHVVESHQLGVPSLKGVIENKGKDVMLQIGKRSWNVKLLRCSENTNTRRLSAGWRLFLRESGLKPGDVCVFELINKNDLIFKVHVF
ncbi:unnamed protein product [Trifolium pratense]|uniref:Uncharacterized protein n=1 Tax=Trifolium pratense TaxID=57577 RepID=A0ACB0L3N9_TRIPR|nr:unnamed protein product [Trifolium pratense]